MTSVTSGSPQTQARTAGLLYLVVILAGMFAEAGVRGQLIVQGDAAGTARNIVEHASLYRWGFVAGVVVLICNLPLAVLLRALLKPVSPALSAAVVLFIVMGSAIEGVSLIAHYAPLILLDDSRAYLAAFSTEQRQGASYLALALHSASFNLSLVFFGCDIVLTGYLVFRSTFLPRAIGLLLGLGGACYLIVSFAGFLSPPFADSLLPYILLPCFVGEVSFTLWLLLKGVNVERWEAIGGR